MLKHAGTTTTKSPKPSEITRPNFLRSKTHENEDITASCQPTSNSRPSLDSVRDVTLRKFAKNSRCLARTSSDGRRLALNVKQEEVVAKSTKDSNPHSSTGASPKASGLVDLSHAHRSRPKLLNCVLHLKNSEPPKGGSISSSRNMGSGKWSLIDFGKWDCTLCNVRSNIQMLRPIQPQQIQHRPPISRSRIHARNRKCTLNTNTI